MSDRAVEGIIFNIQRFSVHDGPGIRTVVFEKGCPLRCRWCANPESQSSKIELAWNKEKCIHCKSCLNAGLASEPYIKDEEVFWKGYCECDQAGVDLTCPSKALHTIGYRTTVDEVLEQIDRDEVFYSNLDGGLTVSGGEPLMQPEFTYELLKQAKEAGIHTAIETTGYAKYEVFERIASQLDYLLMDIKSLDDNIHKTYTGVTNRLILDNFIKIREEFPDLPILVRTPVIPGVNDSAHQIERIYDFLISYDNVKYELLKYHRLGEPKYESLHRAYPMGQVSLDDEKFAMLKRKYQFDHISKEQEYYDGAGI